MALGRWHSAGGAWLVALVRVGASRAPVHLGGIETNKSAIASSINAQKGAVIQIN